MSNTARKARVEITYQGVNITADIAPYLKDFEYNDNESQKADDIQITLEDRELLWMSSWLPKKGDTISATIIVDDWFAPGQSMSLPCGSFQVDEFELQGPPNTVKIKAVSVPITSAARGEQKSKGWERITLRDMAGDIAANAGLSLLYDAPANPYYLRTDQAETSDLSFLARQCEKSVLSMKVTDKQIVIFDEHTYESKSAVREIDRLGGDVKSYSFKSKSAGTAKAAEVSYTDPLTGGTKTDLFEDPNSTSGVTLRENICPEDEEFPGEDVDSMDEYDREEYEDE